MNTLVLSYFQHKIYIWGSFVLYFSKIYSILMPYDIPFCEHTTIWMVYVWFYFLYAFPHLEPHNKAEVKIKPLMNYTLSIIWYKTLKLLNYLSRLINQTLECCFCLILRVCLEREVSLKRLYKKGRWVRTIRSNINHSHKKKSKSKN